ncbi:Uncharacterised protein [Legionella israelensis]|nr:Uncharacterised protein [Legionella israelensis]
MLAMVTEDADFSVLKTVPVLYNNLYKSGSNRKIDA